MTKGEGLVLRLQRVMPADRRIVYRTMTDSALLARWWGPVAFTVSSVDFHPHVGRGYRIQMQPPEGESFDLRGEFREVDPPAHLAFSFCWEPPDPDDRETVASLSLVDRGASTELLLTQGPFATEQRRALHEQGWSESLARLERVLSAGR